MRELLQYSFPGHTDTPARDVSFQNKDLRRSQVGVAGGGAGYGLPFSSGQRDECSDKN